MEKKSFDVKNESLYEFFKKSVLNFDADSRKSVYHYLKDEILFKKNGDGGLELGSIVNIEIYDRSELTGESLVNEYTYKVEEYDSFSVKLVLIEFKINIRDK